MSQIELAANLNIWSSKNFMYVQQTSYTLLYNCTCNGYYLIFIVFMCRTITSLDFFYAIGRHRANTFATSICKCIAGLSGKNFKGRGGEIGNGGQKRNREAGKGRRMKGVGHQQPHLPNETTQFSLTVSAWILTHLWKHILSYIISIFRNWNMP